MKARQVLSDGNSAHDRARRALDQETFRINWVALLALLRAVGHVLKKVDGPINASLKQAIDKRWQTWESDRSQHRIFHDFIKAERDLVLKTYEMRYKVDEAVINDVQNGRAYRHEQVPMESELLDGAFAGRPALDVAKQALDWWASELDVIEGQANQDGV